MTAQDNGGGQAQVPAPRLPMRLKSGGPWTPESPPVVLTDAGLLDLESRWYALLGVVRGIRENTSGQALEASCSLAERSARIDDEALEIEARIAEAPAEGLVGVAVKLRLLDFPRDPDLRDEAQHQTCSRTALAAVERLLIAGKIVG